MRHRNIFRLTVITILTLLAVTSSVFLVVSYRETMLLQNSPDLDDFESMRSYSFGIVHGSLVLTHARLVSDDEPCTSWRLGFKYFNIGHHVIKGAFIENNKVDLLLHGITVHLIVLVLAFAAYPFIAFVRGPLRRYRRAKAGCCQKCGYSLVGNVSGVCPECGKKI